MPREPELPEPFVPRRWFELTCFDVVRRLSSDFKESRFYSWKLPTCDMLRLLRV